MSEYDDGYICIEQHLSSIWSSLKKLSNTDAELKKCVAYKKTCNMEMELLIYWMYKLIYTLIYTRLIYKWGAWDYFT